MIPGRTSELVTWGEEEPPPLANREAWKLLRNHPLRHFKAEKLVGLLDGRASRTFDDTTAAIFGHLVLLAHDYLEQITNWRHGDRFEFIDSVLGRVEDDLLDPERGALRKYFRVALHFMKRHEATRRFRQQKRVVEIDDPEVATNDAIDAEISQHANGRANDSISDFAVTAIQDPRHRYAVAAFLQGYEFKAIAPVVGVTPETVSAWVHRYFPKPPTDMRRPSSEEAPGA